MTFSSLLGLYEKRLQQFDQNTGYTIPLFPQITPLLRRLRKDDKIVSGKPVFDLRDPKKALARAFQQKL